VEIAAVAKHKITFSLSPIVKEKRCLRGLNCHQCLPANAASV